MQEINPTSRRLWLALVLVVLIAAGLGLLFQASFGHMLAVMLIGTGCGVAAIACILIDEEGAGVVCGAIAMCAVLSFIVGRDARARDFRARKAWCEAQVSRLEEYQRQNGVYPARLADVIELGSAPPWVRSRGFEYRISEREFVFDIWDGFLSGWCWDSGKRRWGRYH